MLVVLDSSKTPRLVVQRNLWLVAWALGGAVFDVPAAHHSQVHYILGFTGSLRLIRQANPQFQQAQPQELPFLSCDARDFGLRIPPL